MKTIIPLLAIMFMAGCGNNSMNQSGSTNSPSSEPPASSNNTNSPSVEMTNAPAITNNTGTNIPATTNQ
jgi:uncharacterized lipoprotein YajG